MKTITPFLSLIFVFTIALLMAADDKNKSADITKALKPIYDDKADAEAAIRKALKSAKKENRRVLIQWGGHWCPWCHVLHRHLTTDKDLSKTMLYEYDLVLVD